MNHGKTVMGIILLLIVTAGSIKIIFWGVPIAKEDDLVKVIGELRLHDCRKDRFVEAIKLKSDKTHYWLEQMPNLLPSCESGKENWPIGSNVVLYHTPAGFRADIQVYKLFINGKLIFGYNDAIKSIKSSSNMVLGFTAFMWFLIAFCFFINKKHNK